MSLLSVLPNLKIRKVWLMLTERCNQRCIYCTDISHSFQSGDTSIEVIDALMKFLDANKQTTEIEYWGGEPLLRRDLIKYTSMKYPKHYYLLGTNGVLLQNISIKKEVQHIVVSIDGDKVDQDRQRPLKGGSSSFDKLNWDVLSQCASTVHIVKYPGGSSLVKTMQFFLKKGFKQFQVGYVSGVNHTVEDLKEYYSELEEIADRYFHYVVNWGDFGYDADNSESKFMLDGEITLLVNIKGEIYLTARHSERNINKLGDVFTGYNVDVVNEVLNKFNQSSYCIPCVCRNVCCARGYFNAENENEPSIRSLKDCERIKGEFDIVINAKQKYKNLMALRGEVLDYEKDSVLESVNIC